MSEALTCKAVMSPTNDGTDSPCERRAAPRHHPASPLHAELPGFDWRAEVCDVSAGGIGLRVQSPFQPGWLLSVEVLDRGGVRSPPVLIWVSHSREVGGGAYQVGGPFARPPSAALLRMLMGDRGEGAEGISAAT